MARVHLFADEAGNFDFSRKAGASRFYILTTVAFPEGHDALATSLRALRFELAWDGVDLRREFHATDDTVAVRERVFEVLAAHDFRVDATILEKPKARPAIRSSEERFYRTAWAYHLQYVLPGLLPQDAELHVIAASVGTGSKRREFLRGLERAVRESTGAPARVAFWPAATELGLQAADYCAWAIQRRWERGDDRPYRLIRDRIAVEQELFRRGRRRFY
ncbi:MAG: DUF3800 domain-containing protein [Chloroflexi bacterium]|nr:DUF3800 domain-containing protein [Chloroflexota bacterium]MYD64617.1 DUF3800 domain-containing protein [Chloroflexota bacterium]